MYNKVRLRKKARDKYRSLSEEEKNKKREYGKNRLSKIRKKRISKKLSRDKKVSI